MKKIIINKLEINKSRYKIRYAENVSKKWTAARNKLNYDTRENTLNVILFKEHETHLPCISNNGILAIKIFMYKYLVNKNFKYFKLKIGIYFFKRMIFLIY